MGVLCLRFRLTGVGWILAWHADLLLQGWTWTYGCENQRFIRVLSVAANCDGIHSGSNYPTYTTIFGHRKPSEKSRLSMQAADTLPAQSAY